MKACLNVLMRSCCQDNVKDMLEPALKGTTSILAAAKGEPSVKAVVITSSYAHTKSNAL